MLNEAKIKCALINRLSKKSLEDTVLIDEMSVANWKRRADLAIANGHLHAFEIKSDLDSLVRLEGQLEIYLERFDKVTLIVAEKFLPKVLELAPSRVEVWSVTSANNKEVQFKVIRRGKILNVNNADFLCDFLLKPELIEFLRFKNGTANNQLTREGLVKEASSFPVRDLRSFVLQSLKKRYKERHKNTLEKNIYYAQNTKLLLRENQIHSVEAPRHLPSRKLLNLSKLFPDGNIPDHMPRFVNLPRRNHQ